MGLAMIPEHSWGYQGSKKIGAIYLEQPVERNLSLAGQTLPVS